jgi:SAM-dependent methyltransferase
MLIVRPDRKSNRFRLRRFKRVQEIIDHVISEKQACRILDIGGTSEYWETFGTDLDWDRVQVLAVNLTTPNAPTSRVELISGDARNLKKFPDFSFDFVHSNSVIEHVGRWNDMVAMAAEVRRLAPRFYVQTPYQWFPMEPHAVFPFFHWMPESWRYRIVMARACGFWPRQTDLGQAMNTIQDALLLDKRQFRYLFPDAQIVSEKVFGLTKSLIAIR